MCAVFGSPPQPPLFNPLRCLLPVLLFLPLLRYSLFTMHRRSQLNQSDTNPDLPEIFSNSLSNDSSDSELEPGSDDDSDELLYGDD
jgi:hypothetical protein